MQTELDLNYSFSWLNYHSLAQLNYMLGKERKRPTVQSIKSTEVLPGFDEAKPLLSDPIML